MGIMNEEIYNLEEMVEKLIPEKFEVKPDDSKEKSAETDAAAKYRSYL